MTTIVATRTHLYADSCCVSSGLRLPMPPKIHWRQDCLIGFAGMREEGYLFLDWLDKGMPVEKRPKFEEFAALQVTPGGIVLWDNLCVPMPLVKDTKWWAIGSGRHFALGALAAGATPQQAVEIACQYDLDSGTPVISLALTDKSLVIPIHNIDASRSGTAG